MRAWFHRERPVQVTRRAAERRFVSDNKLDTVIWDNEAVTKKNEVTLSRRV